MIKTKRDNLSGHIAGWIVLGMMAGIGGAVFIFINYLIGIGFVCFLSILVWIFYFVNKLHNRVGEDVSFFFIRGVILFNLSLILFFVFSIQVVSKFVLVNDYSELLVYFSDKAKIDNLIELNLEREEGAFILASSTVLFVELISLFFLVLIIVSEFSRSKAVEPIVNAYRSSQSYEFSDGVWAVALFSAYFGCIYSMVFERQYGESSETSTAFYHLYFFIRAFTSSMLLAPFIKIVSQFE